MLFTFGLRLIFCLVLVFKPVHPFVSPDLTGAEIFNGGIATLGLLPYQILLSLHEDVYNTKPYTGVHFTKSYDQNLYEPNVYQHSPGQNVYQPNVYQHSYPTDLNFCAGVILNANYSLVAANCTYTPDGKPRPLNAYAVRVGSGSLNDDRDPQSLVYRVSHVTVHPDYDISQPTDDNNLALLRHSTPIRFTPYVKRACINLSTDRFSELYTSAYGPILELDKTGYRNYLKYAFTEESLRSSCKDVEVCAYPSTDPPALLSCPAHHGGLLSDFKYDVVALLAPSFNGADSCQHRDTYIRISSYEDFINSVISERGWCRVHL